MKTALDDLIEVLNEIVQEKPSHVLDSVIKMAEHLKDKEEQNLKSAYLDGLKESARCYEDIRRLPLASVTVPKGRLNMPIITGPNDWFTSNYK